MTQQDKLELFRHNLAVGVTNAHKHGLSWAKLHAVLSAKTSECWALHQAQLKLFPENAKHTEHRE